MRHQGGTNRRIEPDEDRLRDTVRVWRLISVILILGASAFEGWREGTYLFMIVGPLLAAAYWAILPRLVRFSFRRSAGPRHGRRRDRPV